MKIKPAHRSFRWRREAVRPRPATRKPSVQGPVVAIWIDDRLVVRPAWQPASA